MWAKIAWRINSYKYTLLQLLMMVFHSEANFLEMVGYLEFLTFILHLAHLGGDRAGRERMRCAPDLRGGALCRPDVAH
jgi:hypothetical protein